MSLTPKLRTEHYDVLARAYCLESDGKSEWRWNDVQAWPMHITTLIIHGYVEIAQREKPRTYRLTTSGREVALGSRLKTENVTKWVANYANDDSRHTGAD